MLIAVQYRDGTFDMVKDRMLDELISKEEIALFRRTNGWVVVARDTVRRVDNSGRYYMGVERRSSVH